MTSENSSPPGFQDMLEFGLIEALMGQRARRFFMGAEIPDGVLAYKSRHKPVPLSELEKLLVVTACGGNTGWHHMIYRAKFYAPHFVELLRRCRRSLISLCGRLSHEQRFLYR